MTIGRVCSPGVKGETTLNEALDAAKQFGRAQGASRVIIESRVRTTGANPGRIPRPVVLDVR